MRLPLVARMLRCDAKMGRDEPVHPNRAIEIGSSVVDQDQSLVFDREIAINNVRLVDIALRWAEPGKQSFQ